MVEKTPISNDEKYYSYLIKWTESTIKFLVSALSAVVVYMFFNFDSLSQRKIIFLLLTVITLSLGFIGSIVYLRKCLKHFEER